ncbi:MAG: aminotransferase class I/II-fold pyridoxal phosphate-dependent enzyme, partial [Paracoccaceae bacterium]|nr:aminotransferase class I/II-fold pyridoxal phosphate-dependent enzyme [Paracoccaceae bacterium]
MDYQSAEWPVSTTPARIAEIAENQIVEIADLGRDNPDVIKLWIGEGDLQTPAYISDAATKALRQGRTRYTYSRGVPALHQALHRYHKRHWGVSVPEDRFSVTCGGMGAIMQAFQAILEPDDEVIVPSPVWPNVLEVVRIVGGKVTHIQFDYDVSSGFSLGLDKIGAAITPRTRAIYINSPGNPTGWVMPRNDMEQLLALAREHGLWLVSDEVYNHFTYERPIAPSFLEIAEPSDRLIITNTFSKNWCMTGWRMGWLIYPQGLEVVFNNL